MSFTKILVCCALVAISYLVAIAQSEVVIEVNDCGDPDTSLIKIKSFDYSPKPLALPGDLIISIEAEVFEDIESPIAMETAIHFTSAGQSQKIPCVNNFGSCFYPDICGTLDMMQCPDFLTEQGFQCKCPIKKGAINLKDATLDLPVNPPKAGAIHAKSTLYLNGKDIACFEIDIKA